MNHLLSILLLTVAIFPLSQGNIEKWQRVYTGDDMMIDIDRSRVTFVENNVSAKVVFASARVGRVGFRTIYRTPQTLPGASGLKYKTRLEMIEFNCVEIERGVSKYPPPVSLYRLFEATLLDKEERAVKVIERNPADEWKEVKFGSMMDKLSAPACELIREKRRNP